jgi:K+-sensing histidine kinase KdpD
MKTPQTLFSVDGLAPYLVSALVVGGTTGLMLLIGREQLGEAVIALLFLVPVGWSASRWGQGPGIFAAITASLAFDFFFIPPFYTFTVGSLEGWLVLAIFLGVAILVVGRIQSSLTKARTSERDAILMYELSTALASLRTQEAVAHTVARFLQQKYLAYLVTVFIQPKGVDTEIAVYEPQNGTLTGKPDRVIPLLNNWGLVGEIQIWKRDMDLPSVESRIFRNFASQIGQAIERAQLIEAGAFSSPVPQKAKVN